MCKACQRSRQSGVAAAGAAAAVPSGFAAAVRFAPSTFFPIASMTLTEAEIRAINLIEVGLLFTRLDPRLPGFSSATSPRRRR